MKLMSRKQLAALAAVVVFTVIGPGCEKTKQVIGQSIKPPTVELNDISIVEISTKRLTIMLHLLVENPNPIGLKVASVTYTLELAGKPLVSGQTDGGVDLRAGTVNQVDVTLDMVYSDVLAVYEATKAVDEVPYKISGKITLDTPLGPLPLPYKSEGMMPVVRPPKVKSIGIDVGDVSLSGLDAVIKLTLENPNGFPLEINYLNYSLFLEGKPFSSGVVIGKPIKPHGVETLNAPVNISFGSAGTWIYNLALKGQASYLLQLDAGYMMKGDKVKQSEEWKGTLKFWK